uniref:Uncharacterized protein n=1 Tax=Opuntia streptacantha TaxID=393608 RepID=A0A7C8ZL50_OPUST
MAKIDRNKTKIAAKMYDLLLGRFLFSLLSFSQLGKSVAASLEILQEPTASPSSVMFCSEDSSSSAWLRAVADVGVSPKSSVAEAALLISVDPNSFVSVSSSLSLWLALKLFFLIFRNSSSSILFSLASDDSCL